MPELSLRHYKAIVLVSELLNFTLASEKLFISVAALSKTVREAEDRLGFYLFERSPRGVSVTRQGMIYLPFARNAVSAHNIASHNASPIKQNRLGSIRVAGTEVVNSAFLFQAIDRYLDLNPDVDISIFESHAEVLQEGLQRSFDIVIGPKRIVPHEVSCLDVCDVPLYFVSAE